MNDFVIDLTHGGVKIAISLAKEGRSVVAYDLYNTLKDDDARHLERHHVEVIQLEDLERFRGGMNVIYPIHMPLTFSEIKSYNPQLSYTFKKLACKCYAFTYAFI